MSKFAKNAMYILDRCVATSRKVEPVVVSGFWRSGTTWLQELTAQAIEAKTIFEPLDKDSFIPFLRGKSVLYRGYIPASAAEFSEADWASLDLAFNGVSPHRSALNYLCRSGLQEALRTRLVIKFVRGQMVLDDLIARYTPAATLHISRHPMPVVQSMLKTDWSWSFGDIPLMDWYGDMPGGGPEGLQQLVRQNPQGTHLKIAALWAITEQAALATRQVTFCRYEDLVAQPQATFSALMRDAGLNQISTPNFDKDSPVTVAKRKGVSIKKRLTSWRKDIPQDRQADLRAVLRDYWPTIDDSWDLT